MYRVLDRVEYIGADDTVGMLYNGHPGQVHLVNSVPSVLSVGFVNGPSLDFSQSDNLRPLDVDDYRPRGRRLVAGLHPLEDRPVETLMAPGHERPEGAEPARACLAI